MKWLAEIWLKILDIIATLPVKNKVYLITIIIVMFGGYFYLKEINDTRVELIYATMGTREPSKTPDSVTVLKGKLGYSVPFIQDKEVVKAGGTK